MLNARIDQLFELNEAHESDLSVASEVTQARVTEALKVGVFRPLRGDRRQEGRHDRLPRKARTPVPRALKEQSAHDNPGDSNGKRQYLRRTEGRGLGKFHRGAQRRRDPVRLRRRRHQGGAARGRPRGESRTRSRPNRKRKTPIPFTWPTATNEASRSILNLLSAQQVLERLVKWADVFIVNTPHPARKKLKLEYDDVVRWNPRLIYADLTGFGEKGPDADLPGFDITSYWARSGLLSMTRDAGEPPTWPVAGSGDNATAVGLYSAIVTALYRRERTGKGSYVTTSLLAEGVWSASVSIQAALCEAKFFGLHDRKTSRKCGVECVSRFGRHLVRSYRHAGQVARRRQGHRPCRSSDRSALRRSGQADTEHGAADRNSR